MKQNTIHASAKESVILLISDDPVSRYMLPTQLDYQGLITIDTNNVQNAIKLLKMHTEISMVLLDLPFIDNLEAVLQLRAYEAFDGLDIIALGEYKMDDHKLALMSAGATDYIIKSVCLNTLVGAINASLMTTSVANDEVTAGDYDVLFEAGQVVLQQHHQKTGS